MKFDKKTDGFTLIEIVVVIGIMAVLTTVIYSSFDASKAQSRDQKRVSDVSTIQLALEQYFQKNGVYPTTLEILIPTYLSSIPTDPDPINDYNKNYFPITKTSSDSDKCISYQLWTRFERSNSYLLSKKGFSSDPLPPLSNMYECGGNGSHPYAKIDASQPMPPYIYDVMP